ncbi:helix-turn-helix domain-containing protein [Halostreptopolyspora alba]|uniref:XRE family transcriptional regulator n=1 Tax=Halostreptopolyspora alba TaxID=2487137 RepID=A0A3N0EHE0_9ACTN|nr:XRE family transcriptional regulator [Nocardiopsaceae bacterium YIM 96095]
MTEKPLPDWVPFGRELRRLRTQTGLSLDDVARNLTISSGMLSKLERATRAPKRDTVGELDQVFCTNGALIRAWSDVTRRVADPDWYRRIEDAEAAAVEIRMHHPSLIPGPLQTPEYARSVLTYGRPLDPPEDIDALLELKTKRSRRLLEAGTPAVSAVIPEGVVRGCLGAPQTVTEQLHHLANLAESGTVGLQIVPSGLPTHIGAATGAVGLFTFIDRLPLVHAEHASGGELIDNPREVQRVVSVFGKLQAWALSPADSIDLVRSITNVG